MARYTNVYSSIWGDNRVQNLSDLGKLFWTYLLTNNCTNLSGYYILPKNNIIADLGKSGKETEKQLAAIANEGLIGYDRERDIVLIKNYLKYNTVKGRPQFTSVASQTRLITRNHLDIDFFYALCTYCPNCIDYMEDGFKNYVKQTFQNDGSVRHKKIEAYINYYLK